jgi:hypothetical protein
VIFAASYFPFSSSSITALKPHIIHQIYPKLLHKEYSEMLFLDEWTSAG